MSSPVGVSWVLTIVLVLSVCPKRAMAIDISVSVTTTSRPSRVSRTDDDRPYPIRALAMYTTCQDSSNSESASAAESAGLSSAHRRATGPASADNQQVKTMFAANNRLKRRYENQRRLKDFT